MHKAPRGSHPSAPTGSSVMRLAVGLRSGAELLVRNQAWAYQMLYREVGAAARRKLKEKLKSAFLKIK